MYPRHTQSSQSSNDSISEEAHGDVSSYLSESDLLNELDFPNISYDTFLDFPVSGVCHQTADQLISSFGPAAWNEDFQPASSLVSTIESDNKRALINNAPLNLIVKEKKIRSNKSFIPLSQSVGVGAPQKTQHGTSKISIVHALEETFRPRYKSDYFAQNGKNRKPRYVADRIGNHFVTIRVPIGARGYIRVHWLTIPDQSGDRYLMPYRFQRSNVSIEISDVNPWDIVIDADKNGEMKLYLVLIKSKQDELKTFQSLQPFQPWRDALNIPAKPSTRILNPKSLIKEYQLDQSQLAFTLCGVAADGMTPVPEWDTTVFSTVMQELPPEPPKTKSVSCPRCLHQFDVTINNTNGELEDAVVTVPNKRKLDEYGSQMIKRPHGYKTELVHQQ